MCRHTQAPVAAFMDVEKTRLGPEFDSLSGQLFAVVAQVAGAKGDSANTGIPEIWIGSSPVFGCSHSIRSSLGSVPEHRRRIRWWKGMRSGHKDGANSGR